MVSNWYGYIHQCLAVINIRTSKKESKLQSMLPVLPVLPVLAFPGLMVANGFSGSDPSGLELFYIFPLFGIGFYH
jgi:hypothetical protein